MTSGLEGELTLILSKTCTKTHHIFKPVLPIDSDIKCREWGRLFAYDFFGYANVSFEGVELGSVMLIAEIRSDAFICASVARARRMRRAVPNSNSGTCQVWQRALFIYIFFFSMKIRILVLFIFYKYFYMLSELSVNILT